MNEFADAIQDETIDTLPPAPRDTYEESIECELTDEDRDAKRQRLESVDRELIRLIEEKKAAAKVFTNQIKPLEAERESILQALDSGTEKRMVECYEHFDERLGKVEVRRVDTDAVVEERAMTAAERDDVAAKKQGDLFGDDDTAPDYVRDPADDDSEEPEDAEESFEPTAEALAQAAEDTGRVVRMTSAEVKKRKSAKKQTNGDAAE